MKPPLCISNANSWWCVGASAFPALWLSIKVQKLLNSETNSFFHVQWPWWPIEQITGKFLMHRIALNIPHPTAYSIFHVEINIITVARSLSMPSISLIPRKNNSANTQQPRSSSMVLNTLKVFAPYQISKANAVSVEKWFAFMTMERERENCFTVRGGFI